MVKSSNIAKEMTGRVVEQSGPWFVVECPDAPPHLRSLNLTARQVMGANVGNNVRLAYHTTPSSGLWNVVEVLP